MMSANLHARLARRSAGRRGFTLVELLVVIAVIALLIGVLVPALAGARESSRRVTSSANLRQLAIFKNLYAEDYDNWFPMVYSGNSTSRHPSPAECAQIQGSYGGYAGFFSYNQKDGQAGTGIYKNDRPSYWNGSRWTIAPTAGKFRPVMDRYMEGSGSYSVLQNPADKYDGGENGPKFPLITPQKIQDEYSVAWHNISYLYIAGLKRTDPTLCFAGDESNAVDWGNKQGLNFPNYYGTMRRAHPDRTKRGLIDVDNHGNKGGNYAYTDGHVEWIAVRVNDATDEVYPHDRIFSEITTFLKKRGDSTTEVQTVD